MTTGQRIKLRRIELGLSQTELAEKMGYKHKSSVSHTEKDRTDLSIELIKRYADVLFTTPEYLIGLTDNKTETAYDTDTDLIVEITTNKSLMTMMQLYLQLNSQHQTNILDQIEYLYDKEHKEG